LFEWEHFDGRIRDEWSGDAWKATEGGVVLPYPREPS
jgi:hypothetical protein